MKLTGTSRRDYEKLSTNFLRVKDERNRYRELADNLQTSLKIARLAKKRSDKQHRRNG